MSRPRTLVLLVLALLAIAVGLLLRGSRSNEELVISQGPRSTAEGELDPEPVSTGLTSESGTEPVDLPRVAEEPTASASAAPKGGGELAYFGRVVRAADRSPVDKALITLHGRDREALGRALSGRPVVPLGNVRSDEHGLFELHCTLERALAVCVDAPGLELRATAITRGHETAEQAFEIELERSSTLAVRLVDEMGLSQPGRVLVRAGIGDLTIDAPYAGPPTTLEEATWAARADWGGNVELRELPPRVPLELVVEAGRQPIHREAKPIVLEPGERRELAIVLGAGGIVRGRMIDQNGTPVTAHEIWLVGVDPRFIDAFDSGTQPLQRARTGQDGNFTFEGVPLGQWRVGPAFAAPGTSQARRLTLTVERVEIVTGSEQVEVTLHIFRGLFVSGSVRDEQDAAVSGCLVKIVSGGETRSWVRSDAEGEFELGPLASGVQQLVAGTAGSGVWEESAPLEVLAGTRGIVLHVRRGGALHGRILGPDGKKQVAGQVEIALIEGGETPGAWAINASKGTFELNGLGAGTYDLIAQGGVGQVCSARVELVAGEQREIELRLQPGATVVLENGAEQELLVELRVDGRFIGSHLLSKAARLKLVVPPSALELRFLDKEKHRLATQSITLRAGEERTLAYPPR